MQASVVYFVQMMADDVEIGARKGEATRKSGHLALVHTLSMGMSLAYLVEGTAGMILVDAGLPGDEAKVLRKMKSLGRDDLRLIFITHAHIDHYGSAAALRTLTGARIAIHRSDAEAMAGGETRLGTARGWGRLVGIFLPLETACGTSVWTPKCYTRPAIPWAPVAFLWKMVRLSSAIS
jgi:glyoxylase-like metal-dependent hydrolase (beta-lactamase superfamily II)